MLLIRLIQWSLMSVMVLSALVSRSRSFSDDPFMDPYIRTIVSMDSKTVATIPKLSDAEFLEFLADDSRANLGLVLSKANTFAPDFSRDRELIYNDNAEEEWESLMIAGPMSIQYVGNLMVLSSKKDFPLRASNYTYEYIKFPDSFRATLTQLSGDMYTALLLAHTSMDKIRLNVRQMPTQIKTVFKLVTTSSNAMIKSMLPRTLTNIAKLASDNAIIANSTKANFHRLQKLLTEIIQVSTVTYSLHQTDVDLIKAQQINATREEENYRQNLEFIKSQYDESKENVAQIRKQYYDLMRQASEAEPTIIKEQKGKGLLGAVADIFIPGAGAILCSFTGCDKVTVRVDNTKFENLFALSQSTLADLERAEAAHRQLYEQYLAQQNALMRSINNMATLDLTKLNHEEIVQLLVKAVEQISEIENQWGRLLRFFSALSNRAESLERIVVQDFVDFMNQAHNDGLLEEVMSREFFNEIVLPVVESIELEGHLLYSMSTTYYEISNQYMMNQIAGINRLTVLQTDGERNNHLQQASSTALATSITVSTLVQQRSSQYLAEVEARREMYTNYLDNILSN